MAMVLTPILKSSMSNTLKVVGTTSSPRVTFDLPTDKKSIIEYFQEDGTASTAYKLTYIVKTISSVDTEESILIRWISEFKDNILFFDKHNESIVNALLKLQWYTKSDRFVLLYQELIFNLVTAHHRYLQLVLHKIISTFFLVASDKEIATEAERKSLQHVHMLSKRITELIPLSQVQFFVLLVEKFPYIKSSSYVLLHYVENLLTVCAYLPSKRHLFLECIVEKLIHIDVLCSKESIELSELEREETNLMEQDSNPASNKEKELDQMAFPLAHTLDMLLDCMYTYIKETCFFEGGEQLNWESTKKLYKELLTVLDKIILPTHGSCHVQYLLFYICSLKQELSEGFLDYLWKKVQNPTVAPVLRQLSVFYIGSFLSRAKYISISTVTACFDLMCNWIHRYIDAHTSQDYEVHGTFHSVCQTVFYIFAFRNKELMDMKNGHKYLRSLNFDRMVTCRLNPLRYCDRTIVHNFASIARNHQIAYVYPIIEKNNRNLLYSCFLSNSEDSAVGAMIPTFFPFDPYLLKKSKHWIESLYRIYNHSQKDEELMQDSIEDEDMQVNDELFSYSMSPGFKKSFFKHMNS